MTREELQSTLCAMAEDGYRAFSARLLPPGTDLLGVRLPKLRALAKTIIKQNEHEAVLSMLFDAEDACFEERILQAFLIAFSPCTLEERLYRTEQFIPLIENWSVCDSFCAAFPVSKKHEDEIFSFVCTFASSFEEFARRFAAVMLLDHFVSEQWLSKTLSVLAGISTDGYYARMAVAWALSVCCVHDFSNTRKILFSGAFDFETMRLAVQKCADSKRLSPEQKNALRSEFCAVRLEKI